MFGFFESCINPFANKALHGQSDSVFGFLKDQIESIKKYLFLVGLFAGCVAVIEVYLFESLGSLVDSLSTQNRDNFWFDTRFQLIEISLVLLVGIPIVTGVHSLLYHQTLMGNFPVRSITRVHQYLMKQNVQFYQTEAAGKISAKLTQTAEAAKMAILKLLDTFIYTVVFFISMAALLAATDVYLLAPIVIWLLGYCATIAVFVPKLKKLSNEQAGANSSMIGKLVDTYTNITTVKLFSHSDIERKYSESHMGEYLGVINRRMRFITKINFVLYGLNVMLVFSTAGLSLWLWSKGQISVGAIAAAVGVVLRVYTMSHWIMWEVAALFANIGIIQDGIKLLSRPLPDSVIKGGDDLKTDEFNVSFQNVDFAYSSGEKVIDKLSLEIKHGEKIGLVGRSGSGKSTLVKLLLRFNEATGGAIKVGGCNIGDLDQESLLKNVAVVAQDVELLERSIRQNLLYGKEGATDAEMIEAAKMAGAHEFIVGLSGENGEKGYDVNVGVRGAKLSGGQRQRLTLARALIKGTPILILDEATSALDSEVESLIMSNMGGYLEGKTVIMIAHRLSTLANMDRIIFLDNGKVVESGSHSDLLAKKGDYYQMWSKQAEGAILLNGEVEAELETVF